MLKYTRIQVEVIGADDSSRDIYAYTCMCAFMPSY